MTKAPRQAPPDKNKYRVVCIRKELVIELQNRADEMEAKIGFRPKLTQITEQILRKGLEAK